MAIDAELVQQLRVGLFQRGIKATEQQIGVALMSIDVDAIREVADGRVTCELWDKQTPINGASAEYVKARSDYVDGEVYLLLIDGRVVVMQPHTPGENGLTPMSVEQARTHGEVARQQLVGDQYFKALATAVGGAIK